MPPWPTSTPPATGTGSLPRASRRWWTGEAARTRSAEPRLSPARAPTLPNIGATIFTMDVPTMVMRVRVDRQGRLVLPKWLRQELGADPGELVVHRTPDGVLLTPATPEGVVEEAADGLPVLHLGREVTNAEVLDGITGERSSR
jgi:AbrB family looped-hinge helix DNA binding protein